MYKERKDQRKEIMKLKEHELNGGCQKNAITGYMSWKENVGGKDQKMKLEAEKRIRIESKMLEAGKNV